MSEARGTLDRFFVGSRAVMAWTTDLTIRRSNESRLIAQWTHIAHRFAAFAEMSLDTLHWRDGCIATLAASGTDAARCLSFTVRIVSL